jgi:hypothetical protein
MATTYNLISSTTLSVDAASVTISSIPSIYKDLVLYSSSRLSVSGRYDSGLRYNGVSTSTYLYQFVEGYATNLVYASSSNGTSQLQMLSTPSDFVANYFSTNRYYIADYNTTGIKPSNNRSCDPNSSTSTFYIQSGANRFDTASGITSITIAANAGNLVANSTLHLYGVNYT